MDGKGRWRDNLRVERLWRSVKYESVHLHAWNDPKEARQGISVGGWSSTTGSDRIRHWGTEHPTDVVVYKFVCKNEKRAVTTDEWLESDVSSGMWRCLDAIPHPGANHS